MTGSKRLNFWKEFSKDVDDHVEYYTVPQYGDYPDDQLCEFEKRDIIVNMKRYLNRIDTNARGEVEAARDCLKLAHYASELYARVTGVR